MNMLESAQQVKKWKGTLWSPLGSFVKDYDSNPDEMPMELAVNDPAVKWLRIGPRQLGFLPLGMFVLQIEAVEAETE